MRKDYAIEEGTESTLASTEALEIEGERMKSLDDLSQRLFGSHMIDQRTYRLHWKNCKPNTSQSKRYVIERMLIEKKYANLHQQLKNRKAKQR